MPDFVSRGIGSTGLSLPLWAVQFTSKEGAQRMFWGQRRRVSQVSAPQRKDRCASQGRRIALNTRSCNGRSGEIRTPDPLLPKQIPVFWLNRWKGECSKSSKINGTYSFVRFYLHR